MELSLHFLKKLKLTIREHILHGRNLVISGCNRKRTSAPYADDETTGNNLKIQKKKSNPSARHEKVVMLPQSDHEVYKISARHSNEKRQKDDCIYNIEI